MPTGTELIVVEQLPVIKEYLLSVSEEIDKIVADATSLVCTDETVKSVKAARADLNKKFNALEEKRKEVKREVMKPYEQFEVVFAELVTDKFRKGDAELKSKIDNVENDLKAQKEEKVKKYYDELASSYGIDFMPWEKSGIKITISGSEKALKEQASRVLSAVTDDLDIIAKQQYEDEILAEYKQSLNLKEAINHVTSIHESIEAEAAKRAESAPAEERAQEAVRKVEAFAPPEVIAPKPEEKKDDPVYSMAFKATGTLPQLKALKQYMIDNGIKAEKVEA